MVRQTVRLMRRPGYLGFITKGRRGSCARYSRSEVLTSHDSFIGSPIQGLI